MKSEDGVSKIFGNLHLLHFNKSYRKICSLLVCVFQFFATVDRCVYCIFKILNKYSNR